MTGLLGGLAAALCLGTATALSSRSSKLIGASSVLAWVMLLGWLLVALVGVVQGVPDGVGREDWAWLGLAGVGTILGLGAVYTALRVGKVGVVAPIAATEGGIAALIAVLAGEQLAPAAGVVLIVIATGVVLASLGGADRDAGQVRDARRAAVLALVAACFFGLALYASSQGAERAGALWVLIVSRTMGVAVVVLPLALGGRMRLTRRALPLVAVGGALEVAGMVAYVLGTDDGVAVPAVVGSQFAAVAAVAGFLFFGERLRRVQLAGVGTILVGVAVLSAVQSG